VRLTRNTVKPLLTALGVAVAALSPSACGREEPDLTNGKALFVENCGTCHILERAGTAGTQGPSLDAAFRAALAAGMDRETVQGVVRRQIANVRRNSTMPEDLVTGEDARDVAAYVGFAAAKSGEDRGALAQAGLAGAETGEQIFTAAGCASCHTFAPAGSNATVGPNLDELAQVAGDRQPGTSPQQYVEASLLNPDDFTVSGFQAGVMPSYEGRLSEEQVQTLVDYLLGR
jgi:mono/diheme cytochrome c family protein